MKDSSLTICIVIPSLGLGGTERQLLHLMRGISEHHDVIVICTRGEGALIGDARRLGTVRILNARSGWDFRVKKDLVNLFKAYRPHIVQSFMFGFDHAVNAAARKAQVPIVISSRRQLATWKERRHLDLQNKANKLVDAIVANSQAVADYAIAQEEVDPDLFHVIRNGIDPRQFESNVDVNFIRKCHHIPFLTDVVGIVANFSPVKDHELFLEIAAELCRRRADVHFVTVGIGPLRERIGRMIEKMDLVDRFTGLTTVSELGDLYKVMAVSVLCSQSEGFPNVIMESMSQGNVVVASNVGGIPELVEHGRTGLLVDSRKPEDFADAIEAVLNDPERSARIGRAAANFVVSNLSVDSMVESYLKLYDRLLKKKSRKMAGR